MSRIIFLYLILFYNISAIAKTNSQFKADNIFFIENKGQIRDQNGNPRADIQFELVAPDMNLFISNGQLHYQFSQRIINPAKTICPGLFGVFPKYNNDSLSQENTELSNFNASEYKFSRMDVEFIGAGKNAQVIAGEKLSYYENYYLPCAPDGIRAQAYKCIVYKNIYDNIDWVIYIKENKLEHEFIVNPGGDVSKIKLKYNGQSSINIDRDGSLTASTTLGTIREQAPLCYAADGSLTSSSFILDNNILSYNLGNYSGALVIDPAVEWATYFGPLLTQTYFYDITSDAAAHIYGCGLTYATSGIATSGAYQTVVAGSADAFLVKFDSSGNRIWGTYYGGTDGDWATALTCDPAGNIYMGGLTNSLTGIATPGTQQTTYGGGQWSGFLSKFDSTGSRKWGTYVGGTAGAATYDLEVASVLIDNNWKIYVTGSTDDSANVATPGSWKPTKNTGPDTTINDYIIQYDTSGIRHWGTYYGSDYRSQTLTGGGCTDGISIYLSGYTNDTSGNPIASPGSFRSVFSGPADNTDAFLAKFNNSGNRLWGTYYGGSSPQSTGAVICGKSGSIYMLGATQSDTGIATTGCFQVTRSGQADAFLAKFDPETGFRIWGTYYGGPLTEDATFSQITTDDSDNVYITGYTNSLSGIASTGAWQTVYGGGANDAFFAAFSKNGNRLWSTYYGGTTVDKGYACCFDGKNVYLCGQTNSSSNIATPGSFLSSGGGSTSYFQGFLAKFYKLPITLNTEPLVSPGASVYLYPTFNNGSFYLSGETDIADGNADIIIMDLTGRIVHKETITIINGRIFKNVSLPREALPGEYLVKVISPISEQVLKFIKQ